MRLLIKDQTLCDVHHHICRLIADAGGRALLVGGCVRDALRGAIIADVDIEVHGLSHTRVRETLHRYLRIDTVGESFQVMKVHGLPIDISVVETACDRSSGTPLPEVSIRESLLRRDFTINAMAYDPLTDKIYDPFGGTRDLRARILRHTSQRFAEDPLRVLRGMQLAARFDLEVAPATVALCRALTIDGIPRERIFEEWRKLLIQGVRPSRGLAFLRDTGWVRYFPEVEALIGCPQDPERHPEGDVWIHTLCCLDAFALERSGDEWEDLVVGMAILCHDFGKPETTTVEQGRIRSIGHEQAGEVSTRRFLNRITDWKDLSDAVVPLVVYHLRPLQLYEAGAGPAAVRRLARKVERIDRLVRVARADQQGRPPLADGRIFEFPAGEWLLQNARALSVHDSNPKPLVMGRHLIELGLSPGPRFKEILDTCYEAQMEGVFATEEDGIKFAAGVITHLPS